MSEARMSREDEIRAMSDERLREIQVYPDILLDLGMGWPARAILDLLTENARLRRENEELIRVIHRREDEIEYLEGGV